MNTNGCDFDEDEPGDGAGTISASPAMLKCAHCAADIDRRTAPLKHDCDHADAWWCVNAQPPCPVSFHCAACDRWTPDVRDAAPANEGTP